VQFFRSVFFNLWLDKQRLVFCGGQFGVQKQDGDTVWSGLPFDRTALLPMDHDGDLDYGVEQVDSEDLLADDEE